MDLYEQAERIAAARLEAVEARGQVISHPEAWLRKVVTSLMDEEHDKPGTIERAIAKLDGKVERKAAGAPRRNLVQEAASLIHHMRKQGVHTEASIDDALGDEYESVRTAAFRIVDGDYRIVGPHGEDLEP